MAPLNKDVHLTVEFLTFMRAGFYGQIMFEQALEKLKAPPLAPGYLDIAHKAFDKLETWLKDAAQGLPIFATAWDAPETFDAVSAFGFMRELKKELKEAIPGVIQALQIPDLSQDRDSVKLLAAAILRSASVRHSYVETLAETYTRLQAQEQAQPANLELPGAKEYLQIAYSIVETFSTDGVYDQELCERLRVEAALTPNDFRAHLHDANILLNVFNKEFTFEAAEFRRDEAEAWIEHKIPAVAAGYWAAYGFVPQEFVEWKKVGIIGAPLAANWRRAGFSPADGVKWITEGFSPRLARIWRDADFDPARAAALVRRGIMDPAKAPRDIGEEAESSSGSDESDSF